MAAALIISLTRGAREIDGADIYALYISPNDHSSACVPISAEHLIAFANARIRAESRATMRSFIFPSNTGGFKLSWGDGKIRLESLTPGFGNCNCAEFCVEATDREIALLVNLFDERAAELMRER